MVKRVTKIQTPIRLHLGCGDDRRDGMVNVDCRKTKATDRVVDLRKPWPWQPDTIDGIESKDLLPCLTPAERMHFMNEAWRVLKVGAQMSLQVPGRGSDFESRDPTYLWPPISEQSFYFYTKDWREKSGYGHYPITADFHWGYGFVLDSDLEPRNEETQRHAIKTQRNAVVALIVTLTKLKPEK